MSYRHYLTARYGDVTPFYVFDAWSKDKVPFSSFHELRNYTMSSPLMSKIKMYKDYFMIPYKAILPRTWDLILANPTQGDDVPDDANCVVRDLVGSIVDMLRNLPNLPSQTGNTGDVLTYLIKSVFLAENVLSDGGLFSLLGCKLSKYACEYSTSGIRHISIYFNNFYDVLKDYFIDNALYIQLYLPSLKNGVYKSFSSSDFSDDSLFTFRKYLELMRDNSDFYIKTVGPLTFDSLSDIISSVGSITTTINSSSIPINLSRLVAYQLSYFHFMTNDKIDFIYSASLYRDMLQSILYSDNANRSLTLPTFDYNGVSYQYDVFSGYNLILALSVVARGDYDGSPSWENALMYLLELTSFRKSLKFGDYFTGGRPQPLAVGDVNAPVVENGVSAIDITKNISMQRFLNAVNKTGRKMSDYAKKILGGYEIPVSSDPKFLARDSVYIGTQEVENTADNQGAVTTLLRSDNSRYAFECEVSEPCIILGLCSFEVERAYSRTIDRHFFHTDRFDMFNPYFQNIGDQEVYMAEKGLGGLTPFAYQLRHMEYKQRYSIASGGFVHNLPSWSFISDNDESIVIPEYDYISPDFIRSNSFEFDRFYSSLSGVSYDSYFHFILKFDNQSTPIRNMEFNPTIL